MTQAIPLLEIFYTHIQTFANFLRYKVICWNIVSMAIVSISVGWVKEFMIYLQSVVLCILGKREVYIPWSKEISLVCH